MIRNLVGAKELRRQLRTHPRHLQQGGPRWPNLPTAVTAMQNRVATVQVPGISWYYLFNNTCVLEVYLSTSAGTFKHLICTFSTSFLWLNGLGEFGASLQSPLHVEAAWRGRHLRRKIIRAGHLPSTSICQRHLLEQPTATLGHLRTQPKATIGHLEPPLASWVSASTHLRAINSTNHQIFQTRYKPWTSKCFSWRCR